MCSIFMICLFVIIFFYLLYYNVPQTKIFSCVVLTTHETSTTQTTTVLSTTAPTYRNSCELSLNELNGWFCEFDDDWKRQKLVHQTQDKLNRHTDDYAGFFINNWKPTIQCPLERRIGSKSDGGKWVCDVHRLDKDNYVPVIYSFGSSGELSFELEIKQILPKAEIHTFDRQRYSCPVGVCTFHQAIIGDGTRRTKSLDMIIDELGHRQRQIDILKIDIEGGEYKTFKQFFKHPQNTTNDTVKKQDEREIPYIRQILIEIHMPGGELKTRGRPIHELFELFRFNNYAIFHKEVNVVVPNNAYEYALIRLNPKFFVSS